MQACNYNLEILTPLGLNKKGIRYSEKLNGECKDSNYQRYDHKKEVEICSC